MKIYIKPEVAEIILWFGAAPAALFLVALACVVGHYTGAPS